MRIINGKYRSKRIIAPKNLPVRPTTDMAKEALFNLIDNTYYIENLTVLDLFSGTGNITYEFASRGAQNITCVDIDHRCIKFIKSNIKELAFDQVQVIKANVFSFLKSSSSTYRLIFADPPYHMDKQEELISRIMESDLLSEDGWFIIEHDNHHNFDHLPGFSQKRRYGSVNFSIFSKN
jgi:16S rRNA (guanine(966)-N(2))-methyltransferase RsmD